MKLRGLIVAAVVLAALSGVLYWSNHRKPADETAKANADAPPKILSLNQPDITQLALQRKGEAELTLVKNASGSWQITSPKPLAADQDAVSSVLATLSSLTASRLIEEKAASLTPYGLATPAVSVSVTTKDGTSRKLLLGDSTPTDNAVYAALAGDPRVFTVASYDKSSLDKTAADLRDKRLLTADFDKVTQIELREETPKNKGDITFGRDKDGWQILKPKPFRADSSQVEGLVSSLRDATMETDGGSSDAKNAAAFASAPAFASAKITGAFGTQELEVRKAKDDYYAKSSVVPGAFKISGSIATGIDKSLDDFRNKKLFDFGYEDPDKVEFHDGAKAYFLTHSGADWWGADGKKLDPTGVDAFLEKLRGLTATKFPDSGFAAPAIEITVLSNGGKRSEEAAVAKSGDAWIAKREHEPALYELAASSVSELQKAAAELKPATAPPSTKKK